MHGVTPTKSGHNARREAALAFKHELANGAVAMVDEERCIYLTPTVFTGLKETKVTFIDGKAGCFDDSEYLTQPARTSPPFYSWLLIRLVQPTEYRCIPDVVLD